jgi:hypothetical protein
MYAFNQRRLQLMDEDSKKKRQDETKRLQEETKALLEQSNRHQKESEKASERLRLIAESERIEFNRYKPNDALHRDMTIYYDKLTDEQKLELERIDKILFDMADKVEERGGRRILKSGE